MLKYLNPKGTLYYEIVQLGFYWANMLRQPTDQITEEKISYGSHHRQYLMLFQPKQQIAPPKGVLIYLHGGAWRFGSPEAFRSTAQFFTERNYIVVLPSHRRCPTYNYRHIKADLIDILKTTDEVLQERSYHHLPRIIGGMSAGGHLSALAFYDRQIHAQSGWQAQNFAGAFLLGAPLHLAEMANTRTLRNMSGKRSNALFQEANPYNHIEEIDDRPLLIIHGEKDGMVAYRSALAFVEKLEQQGFPNFTFHKVENGSHLDVASWSFAENATRKALLNWLDKIH